MLVNASNRLWLAIGPLLCLASISCAPVGDPSAIAKSRKSPQLQAENEKRRQILNAAQQASDRRDFAAAEKEYQKLVALDRADLAAWTTLARFYDERNRPADAIAAWKEVMEPTSRSVSSLQKDPRALAHYGDLLLAAGKGGPAHNAFAGACVQQRQIFGEGTVLPTDPTNRRDLQGTAHFAAATRWASHGDHQAAVAELWRAFSFMPRSAVVNAALAFEFRMAGDVAKAGSTLERALQLASPSEKGPIAKLQHSLGLDVERTESSSGASGATTTKHFKYKAIPLVAPVNSPVP